MTEYRELAEFARALAVRAGACIGALRAARSVDARLKDGGRELVTSADLASDDLIREALQRHTPAAQYLSEEGDRASIDWARPVWVVDPLDGTVNYVYGHSHVGVSLAYVVGGEAQLGVVHAPFQAETFVAIRGRGASLNGVPLSPPPDRALEHALVATGFPHDHAELETIVRRLGRVVNQCRDLRRLAAPAVDICWVAAGRIDASYETLKPWDVAAAGLVARETAVARGHFGADDEDLPREVRGRDVAFARQGLLDALLRVLSAKD